MRPSTKVGPRGDFGIDDRLFSPGFSWEQHSEAVEPGSRQGTEVGDALRNIFEVYEDFRIGAEEQEC